MSATIASRPVAAKIFRFVQFEVPWPLGPEDGRYVVRRHAGEQPDHVLVLATLGAEKRGRRGKRDRSADPEPAPTPVATGRATVIAAEPLESDAAAARWLNSVDRDAEVGDALVVLNRALHAHRISVADPYAREVGRDDALVIRVGYGAGEQVAEGRWTEAVDLGHERRRRQKRTSVLRPQERLAALLSGRDASLACELLALRARSDIDNGRQREAALQLRPALDAALAELPAWAERGDLPARIEELGREQDTVTGLERTALERGLDPDEIAEVERVLRRIEAALRARTAAGIG
jgi:hypothetical protein